MFPPLQTFVDFVFSYFPIEATKEMLLEFRPLMCPTDATKTNAATNRPTLGLVSPSSGSDHKTSNAAETQETDEIE